MGNDHSVIENISRHHNNNRYFRVLYGISVFLFVIMFFCKETEIQVEQLRIGTQFQGWTEKEGSYRVFDAEGLFEIINGGAPEYIDHGLIKGITQQVVSSDSMTIELFAEDFGSPEKAQAMYIIKKEVNEGADSDTSDNHRFVISKVIGGFWCFGTIGKYYFEVTISGCNNIRNAHEIMQKLFKLYKTVTS